MVIRVSETRQVNNSAWINSVLWAPRGQGALGWVALALLRQKKCFCACWRLGEGSWPGHSASILASATEARQRWAPTREAQARGGMGPGRQSCSCCVWFPFGPRDLDKRAAFIDWGDWEREGGGSRISLCLFVFLSKHLLSIYCGPGIMVNAFHALSGRIHMTALLLESHSSEEVTKAQKV